MNCYCSSGRKFADCCAPFIDGTDRPATAERLMRSRYSAYALVNVDYILRTTHPSTRRFHERAAIEEWARSSRWQKLEIISTTLGGAKDKRGTVEFKAFYLDATSEPQIHHENSNFAKELGKWFFVDGKIIK
jgi:SEC-C motif-containing protein